MIARLVTDDYVHIGFVKIDGTPRFIVYQHRVFERNALDERELLYRESRSVTYVTPEGVKTSADKFRGTR